MAIKIIRDIERYTDSAEIEADILEMVNRRDRDGSSLCVRMYDRFLHEGHMCLVFEKLSVSLYDFMKANRYRPFPIETLRHFCWQMLTSIAFLHEMELIHTDLKPENVLLVSGEYRQSESDSEAETDESEEQREARLVLAGGEREKGGRKARSKVPRRVPLQSDVRVIDFGGATFDNEHKSTIVNTRQYRAPEVTLGLGWSYPSDIWSLGCIFGELYLGDLLYATHENLEHLALIERSLGRPLPQAMIQSAVAISLAAIKPKSSCARGGGGTPVHKYFCDLPPVTEAAVVGGGDGGGGGDEGVESNGNGSACASTAGAGGQGRELRLRFPEGGTADGVKHVARMKSLEELIRPVHAATGFLELMKRLLDPDPSTRITAKDALALSFFAPFHNSNSSSSSSSNNTSNDKINVNNNSSNNGDKKSDDNNNDSNGGDCGGGGGDGGRHQQKEEEQE